MNENELREAIKSSLSKVIAENPSLISINRIGERAFCFRFGTYFSAVVDSTMNGYFVDAEYNRVLDEKEIEGFAKYIEIAVEQGATDEVKRKLAIPDFIIHKRSPKKDENFLVMEVKWSDAPTNDVQFAKQKLEAFRSRFEYKFCILLTASRSTNDFVNNCSIEFIP